MATEWKQTSFEMRLTPQASSKIEDVINDAHRIAIDMNVVVCFNFNGLEMRVSGNHKKEWLLGLWKTYLEHMSLCKGEAK
jgi:hypothetical protein